MNWDIIVPNKIKSLLFVRKNKNPQSCYNEMLNYA